jgi:predicted molibdopterin-dependent oxidoreductase YjgC
LVAGKVDLADIKAMWVIGGYKDEWINDATAKKLAGVPLLIVQDLFDSPLMKMAHYQLPAAAFAERDGSYVNHGDRLQSFKWAVRPPAGVKVEGALFWQLLGMVGLYSARKVLDEVAGEIGYFHVASQPVPDVGVDLKVNQLAGVS